MSKRSFMAIRFLVSFVLPCAAYSDDFTWTGNSDNNWFNADNWEPINVPDADDQVIINSGLIMLTNATKHLASFSMAGGTLTCSNWNTRIESDAILLQSGSGGGIYIECRTFSSTSGIICAQGGNSGNGTYQAYSGGSGGGYRFDGASYGGLGGKGGYNGGYPGAIYGSSNAPVTAPGSGGGYHGNTGGMGGGLIDIECLGGTVHLDGLITAIGKAAVGNQAGSGSGGGINIVCRILSGSGMLCADGGAASTAAYSGGPGGGGRIAILRWRHLFTGSASVEGGIGVPDERHITYPGSIYWISPNRGLIVKMR